MHNKVVRTRDPTVEEQAAIDLWWHDHDHEYDCVDNHRVASPDNLKEVEEYGHVMDKGCCGFCDIELTTANGVKFMYGFNYGH